MTSQYFIDPIDVLFLRGNKLFGDPGSFGDSLVPPWPSVGAGALRSALLAHKGYDLARFARGEITNDAELGTPERPGSFVLTEFQLAVRLDNGDVDRVFAMPADLVARRFDDGVTVQRMTPWKPPAGIVCSTVTEQVAVLPEKTRGKPLSSVWLTSEGWASYVKGHTLDGHRHLVYSRDLWELDVRIGVGLDPERRRAEDGKLFTAQAVVFRKKEHRPTPVNATPSSFDVGFLATVTGASLPEQLTLRLGGDGRGAVANQVKAVRPEPDFEELARTGRCRLILTTPGLFAGGWRPTGVIGSEGDWRFDLVGARARLVAAAISRPEVVSGFDLAAWQPKPALRAAPTGSVYWLDNLDATPDALRKLIDNGLWSEPPENAQRRAEGFNRCMLAAY